MRRYIFFMLVAGVILVPTVAQAVSWIPIVPCGSTGQEPCSPCHLFEAFHNVIDLVLYGITGPIAAFLIVIAGGRMLLSAGNVTQFKKGKEMLTNTLIGVTIILLSWVFVNFLIKSLATGNQGDGWNEFTCPVGLSGIVNIETEFPSVTPPAPPSAAQIAAVKTTVCTESNLAAAYGVPNDTTRNAPSLDRLMSCIERDPIARAMAYLVQNNNKFTYELTNPLCNLTRGDPVCGTCQHSKYSCHYGGKTGNQGAMAVDYNWNGKTITYVIATRTIVSETNSQCVDSSGKITGKCRTVTGEQGLFDELYRSMVKNSCQYKFLNFEMTKSGAHTHISTADCSSDVSDVQGRKKPVTP